MDLGLVDLLYPLRGMDKTQGAKGFCAFGNGSHLGYASYGPGLVGLCRPPMPASFGPMVALWPLHQRLFVPLAMSSSGGATHTSWFMSPRVYIVLKC